MKKIYLTLIIVISMIQFSFAQWSTISGTTNISNTNTGNVGVGTTTPAAKLDVNGAMGIKGIVTSDTQNIAVSADGTYVIASGARLKGTYILNFEAGNRIQTVVLLVSAAQYDGGSCSLSILGNTSYGGSASTVMSNFRLVFNSDNSVIYFIFDVSNRNGGTLVTAHFDGSGAYNANWGGTLPTSTTLTGIYPLILNNGNVLMGKTSQSNTAYRLDVAGNVRANQITVNTTGADFVFDPNYSLKPLSYIKNYVDEHHHLPGIASAKEMQNNGLDLGENQTRLLQKVEELTLYLIEKDKQLKAQEDRLKELEERLDALENK